VITTRVGAAFALILSIAALALAIAAYAATVRDESLKPGRIVQTRVNTDYQGGPILFVVDDFYIGYNSRLEFSAFYVHPPGYYGHQRGCKVVWDPDAVIETVRGTEGPGLYIDPCGGARFNRDGELVDGPADRGLDYFGTEAGVDGVFVDTRTLFCGMSLSDEISATLTPALSPTGEATAVPTETPTIAAAPDLASPSVTTTATASPTTTSSATAIGTRSPTPKPSECERVSPNSKRR
jgi:hypothetical protein